MAPVCPIMTPKLSQSPYTFHNTVEWNRDRECNHHEYTFHNTVERNSDQKCNYQSTHCGMEQRPGTQSRQVCHDISFFVYIHQGLLNEVLLQDSLI